LLLQPVHEKSGAVKRQRSIGSGGYDESEDKNLQNSALRLLTKEAI